MCFLTYIFVICILLVMQSVDNGSVCDSSYVINAGDDYMNLTQANIYISFSDSATNNIIPPEIVHWDLAKRNNITPFTVANLQNSYCSARCHSTCIRLVQSLERCPSTHVNCYPCDCNRPQCEVYGTCCPEMTSLEEIRMAEESAREMLISTPSYNKTENKTVRGKQHPRSSHTSNVRESPGKQGFQKPSSHPPARCDEYSLHNGSFLYFRSCPVGFTDQHIRRSCEEDLLEHEQTVEAFTRVSDNLTGIVYYNKYCAECMHASEPTAWNMSVNCEHYLRVYSARNKDELFKLSLHPESFCTVYQEYPPGLVLHSCQSEWYDEVFESCNETGQWSEHDQDIVDKCENSSDIASRVRVYHDNTTIRYYKNIFCAICNSDSKFLDDYWCSLQKGFEGCYFSASMSGSSRPRCDVQSKVLPFSLLFGSLRSHKTPPDSGMKFKECQVSEWSSPDGTCLPLQCTSGKFLDDGNCTTAIQEITGLGYSARVLYLPTDIQSDHLSHGNSSETLNLFMKFLQEEKIFSPDVSKAQMTVSFVWEEVRSPETNTEHTAFDAILDYAHNNATTLSSLYNSRFFFYVEVYFIASKSISRDTFESGFLIPFLVNTSKIQIAENLTVLLAPKLVPHVPDLLENSCIFPQKKSDIVKAETVLTFNKTVLNNTMWSYKKEFLFSSGVLTCVHVSFNKSQFNISVNCTIFPPTWQIVLKLGQIKLIFSESSDMNRLAVEEDDGSNGGQMSVCLDLLEEAIQKQKIPAYNSHNSQIELWLYYLTHVCISMSLLTLLITLVVYLLLASLRNEAGINNMFLSGTLLLAQSSLLASSHVKGPNLLCIIVGISTHFLWLSTITWSCICCFHMFRVFTSKAGISKCTISTQRNNRMKKVVIGVIAPASIVALVIVSMYLTSEGQKIGYTDSYPCYLDSSFLAVVSLAMPLGVVTLANVFFFASTVHQIQSVKKLQTHAEFHKKETQTLIIYVKLSSLTGAFWTITIIAEYTDNDPLRFIAIILNGLQGTFLFLSFVCTKRVTRLFFQVLQPEKCSPNTIISKSTRESKDKNLEKSSTM